MINFEGSGSFIKNLDLPRLRKEIRNIDNMRRKTEIGGMSRSKSPYYNNNQDGSDMRRIKGSRSFSRNTKKSTPKKIFLNEKLKKINNNFERRNVPGSLRKEKKGVGNIININPKNINIEIKTNQKKFLKKTPKKSNDPNELKKSKQSIEKKVFDENSKKDIRENLKKKHLSSDIIFANYEVKSQAGMMNGVSKINQDSYFIETKLFGIENLAIMAVFDGHGNNGHRVSGFLRAKLRSKLKSINKLDVMVECLTKIMYIDQQTSPQNQTDSMKSRRSFFAESDIEKVNFHHWLKATCLRLDELLVAEKSVETYLSGSTGIISVTYKSRIVTANVGDSRAILIKKEGKDGFKGIALSRDLKPTIEEEKQRIIDSGGEVKQYLSKK